MPMLNECTAHFVGNDMDWPQFEIFVITLHPDLGPEPQAVVADDFETGKPHLTPRPAMRLYFLRMQPLDGLSLAPSIQSIVWLNREQFKTASPVSPDD